MFSDVPGFWWPGAWPSPSLLRAVAPPIGMLLAQIYNYRIRYRLEYLVRMSEEITTVYTFLKVNK